MDKNLINEIRSAVNYNECLVAEKHKLMNLKREIIEKNFNDYCKTELFELPSIYKELAAAAKKRFTIRETSDVFMELSDGDLYLQLNVYTDSDTPCLSIGVKNVSVIDYSFQCWEHEAFAGWSDNMINAFYPFFCTPEAAMNSKAILIDQFNVEILDRLKEYLVDKNEKLVEVIGKLREDLKQSDITKHIDKDTVQIKINGRTYYFVGELEEVNE